jgi:pre-rRNA-processing protein TSR3
MDRKIDSVQREVPLFVYSLGQDDPKKCTAAKLCRFKMAKKIKVSHYLPPGAILLDPLSEKILLPSDRDRIALRGVVAIDCSWKKVDQVFSKRFRGRDRRLPLLLPANPVSYGKASRLSSLEALSATLFICKFTAQAEKLLTLFKWGATFLTLNKNLLEEYSRAVTVDDVVAVERSYF